MENFRGKVLNIFFKINRSQKFYILAISVLPLLLFGFIFNISYIKLSAFQILFLFSFCGVMSDLLYLYKKTWSTLIGKGLILVIYATSTNFALSISYQILNEIIKVEPTMLKYSLAFTSTLTLPLFIAIGFMIVFGLIFAFGQFYLLVVLQVPKLNKNERLYKLMPPVELHPGKFFIARMFAYPLVVGLILGVARGNSEEYSVFLTRTVKKFIYTMEAVKYSRCKLSDKQKSIKINNKEIIVVQLNEKDEYIFTHTLCKQKL